ncbi:nitroreductase [Histoplasma capsulatum var. duboisii H88]|uniref:Nitroreductase n=4 Tax=Ajellomyces capsulatus TaxID=5037 RepID=C0NY58_AJECG|nr:nitroreductase [Histoplasma capsulatum G186AR]EER37338.1 nitroreductase [Histoplasma capsulatum H143]EGC48060.1 nitroreductase [Histoplasma capsulatum var. duboisii H88]KAG5293701.1 nitroreductase [Histoplasma capsulatum]EEH03726.1 nitroreductase [Histoplasma capsulatum G186AR]QSS54204.1 nitroreductase [Histoplasma capsulatum var. duboisii H88]
MTVAEPKPLIPAATAAAFIELAKARRSVYTLSASSPVPDSEIQELVKSAILHVPSSFNTQSTRLVLLLHEEHRKLWDAAIKIFVESKVAPGKMSKEMWETHTKPKLQGFRAAYGTILFFEDPEHIAPMAEKFPTYRDQFAPWAQHTNAMHQYFLWLALRSVGLAANLQHYNPLIDDTVAKTWSLPAEWKLVAQMVFGTSTDELTEKTFKPLEERVKVFGSKE